MPAADAPLRWTLPGGVTIACSTAADGDQRQAGLRARWLATVAGGRACAVPRQVHGAVVVDAGAPPEQLALADGVVSADGSVALGVYGADCPGLCLVAGPALGMAHCGWRGTAAGIVGALVARLRQAVPGIPPERWSALIGPGISGARYEVDAPVLGARSWPAEALAPARPGHAHLDLARVIAADLRAAGIVAVHGCGICTHDDPRLWSFRRRGAGQVQLLAAWRG
jgi:hypothetical protein